MKDTIELTRDQLPWFWSWKSSRAVVRLPSGRTYGLPRPRPECTIRVSGKIITLDR